jgi:hypothetical protein
MSRKAIALRPIAAGTAEWMCPSRHAAHYTPSWAVSIVGERWQNRKKAPQPLRAAGQNSHELCYAEGLSRSARRLLHEAAARCATFR